MEIHRCKTHEVKPNIHVMIGTALVVTQIALRMICLYTDTNGRLGRRYLPTTELRLRQAQSKILASTQTYFQSDRDEFQFGYTESMSDGMVNKALDAIEVFKKSGTEEGVGQFRSYQRIEAGHGREISRKHTSSRRKETRQRVQSTRASPTAGTAGTSSTRDDSLSISHTSISYDKHRKRHKKPPVKTIGAVRMDYAKTQNTFTDDENIDAETAQINLLNAAKSSSTGRLVAASVAAVAARITAAQLANTSVTTLPMSSSDTDSLRRLILGPDPMRWYYSPTKRKTSTSLESDDAKQSQNGVTSLTKDNVEESNFGNNGNADDRMDNDGTDVSIPSTSTGVGVKTGNCLYSSPNLVVSCSEHRLRKPKIEFIEVKDDSPTDNAAKPGKDSVISYTPLEIYANKDQEEEGLLPENQTPCVQNCLGAAIINKPKSNQFMDNKSGQKNVDGGLLTMAQSSGGLLDQTIMTRCQLPFSSESDQNLGNVGSDNEDERRQNYPSPLLIGGPPHPQGGGGRLLLTKDIPDDKIETTSFTVKQKKMIFYNRLFPVNTDSTLTTSIPSGESVPSYPFETDRSTVTLTQSAKSSLTIINTGSSALKFTQTDESLLSFEGGANGYFSLQETGNSDFHADHGRNTMTTERSDNRSLSIGDSSGITYHRRSSPMDGEGSKKSAQNKEKINNDVRGKWCTISTAKTKKIKAVVDQHNDLEETQNDGTSKQENGFAEQQTKRFHFSKEISRDLSFVVGNDKPTPSTKKIFLADDQNGRKSCNERRCSVTTTSSESCNKQSKRPSMDRDSEVAGYKRNFPSTILGVPNGSVLLPGLKTAVLSGELSPSCRQLASKTDSTISTGTYSGSPESTRPSGIESRTETQSSYVTPSDVSTEGMFEDTQTSGTTVYKVLPGTKSGRHSYPETLPVNSDSKAGRSSLPLTLSSTPYGGAPLIGVKVERYREPFPRSSLGNVIANRGLLVDPEAGTRNDSVTRMGPGFSRLNIRPFSRIQTTPFNSATGLLLDGTSPVNIVPVSSSRHLIAVESDALSTANRNSISEANENEIQTKATLLPSSSGKEIEMNASQPTGAGLAQLSVNKSKTAGEPPGKPPGKSISQLVKSMGFCAQQAQQSDNVSFSRRENSVDSLPKLESNVGSTSAANPKETSLTSGSLTINKQISLENLLQEQMMKYTAISKVSSGSRTSIHQPNQRQTEEISEFSNSNGPSHHPIPLLGSDHQLGKRRRKRRQHSSPSDSSSDGSEAKNSLASQIFVKENDCGVVQTGPVSEIAARKTVEDSGLILTQKGESRPATTTGKPFGNKAVERPLPCTETPARDNLLQQEVGGTSHQGVYDQTAGETVVDKVEDGVASSERSPEESTVEMSEKFETTIREKAQSLTFSKSTSKTTEVQRTIKENAQGSTLNKQTERKVPTDEDKCIGQRRSDSEGILRRKFSSGLGFLIESASFIPTVSSLRSIIRAPRMFFSSRRLNEANNRRSTSNGSTEQVESAAEEVCNQKWCNESSDSEDSLT